MSNAFALYSDVELETLITQFKAALPKAMAGQRVRVGDSEYDRATIESLKAFGDALGREKAQRAGAGSRLTTVRPRRPDSWRGW